MGSGPRATFVQDHIAQRGGAERVALSFLDALGINTVHTSVFAPERTYPEFAAVDVRPMFFSGFPLIRNNHRLAFPLMAPGFSSLEASEGVTFAASAGWSHGVRSSGRKVVYWYAPPRWIYQQNEYLGRGGWVARGVKLLTPILRAWDRRAVRSANRHLAVSNEVANRLKRFYNVDAEVIHPPITLDGPSSAVDGLRPGYLLIVSRLLSYKNVHIIAEAMERLPHLRLVIAGSGPFAHEVMRAAPENVSFIGSVSDGQLSWLYENCVALVAAAYEDFGLTPLEAAHFGRPSVALRAGGYLDTIEEGVTGQFFETLSTNDLVDAIEKTVAGTWSEGILRAHAARFSQERFVSRIRQVLDEERACLAEAEHTSVLTS